MRAISVKYALLLLSLSLLASCKTKDDMSATVKEWFGNEILFPDNTVFTVQGKDTVDFDFKQADYKIVTYIDSLGCISCQLRLSDWENVMEYIDSTTNRHIPFVFYFSPKKPKQIADITRRESFFNPICIDPNGDFNSLNHFPEDMSLRTFLIDRNNKVLAVGNPMLSSRIKELYAEIINGTVGLEETDAHTEIELESNTIDFGTFAYTEVPTHTFKIRNTGDSPLVIQDVNTSCGCTDVSYSEKPVMPNREAELIVSYKPDKQEVIHKTITIFCNTVDSPYKIEVRGRAK